MMSDRKGYVFEIFLVIFTFIVLAALLFFVINDPFAEKSEEFRTRGLGREAALLFLLYQEGEKAQLYTDIAAQYAADASAFLLADLGGFVDGSPCGTVGADFALWNQKETECFPDPNQGFATLFFESIVSYLQEYPGQDVPGQPYGSYHLFLQHFEQDYRLFFSGTRLIGVAPHNIKFTLTEISTNIGLGTLTFPSGFNIDFGYDISIYQKLFDASHALLERCRYTQTSRLDTCITDAFAELRASTGLVWSADAQCAPGTRKRCFTASPPEPLSIGPISYRFALDFSFPGLAPIQTIDVAEADTAEGRLLVSFDESEDEDIERYTLYFVKNSDISSDRLKTMSNEEIKNHNQIKQRRFDAVALTPLDTPPDPANCGSPTRDGCTYGTSQPIQPGVGYRSGSKLYYLLSSEQTSPLDDGTQYNIMVSVINRSGDESTIALEAKGASIAPGTSRDDLPPEPVRGLSVQKIDSNADGTADTLRLTWNVVTSNVDGTPLDDFASYTLYCFAQEPVRVEGQKATFLLTRDLTGTVQNLPFADITSRGCSENDFFGIVAVDRNGNQWLENIETVSG